MLPRGRSRFGEVEFRGLVWMRFHVGDSMRRNGRPNAPRYDTQIRLFLVIPTGFEPVTLRLGIWHQPLK
jgi:hypothetical protein